MTARAPMAAPLVNPRQKGYESNRGKFAMSEFGNTHWAVYVAAAYLLVGAALAGFALFSLRERAKALQSLKDEGFLSDG